MKQFTKEDPVYQIGFRDGYSEGYSNALKESNEIAQRHLDAIKAQLEKLVNPCAKE